MLSEPDIGNITHLFLVGGFAESSLLQVKSYVAQKILILLLFDDYAFNFEKNS